MRQHSIGSLGISGKGYASSIPIYNGRYIVSMVVRNTKYCSAEALGIGGSKATERKRGQNVLGICKRGTGSYEESIGTIK